MKGFLNNGFLVLLCGFLLCQCGSEHLVDEPLEDSVSSADLGRVSIDITDALADEIRHVDAQSGPWETETLNKQAEQQVARLLELIKGPGAIEAPSLTEICSETVTTTGLRPDQLATVRSAADYRVGRGSGSQETFSGRDGLVRALAQLRAPFAGASEMHALKKIFRIELKEERAFATEVIIQISGHTAEGIYLQNSVWRIRWAMPVPERAPLIQAIELAVFDESRSPEQRFSDATAAALGDAPHWREQFLTSTDQWCAQVDASAGANQYAHNGLAIGDLDNDGREDLYVCQMGGLPNRLFRQNADGSMTDIAPAAGVDWLDETRAALFIDLDNDGNQDLLVTTMHHILLLAGNGSGDFKLSAELPFPGGYSAVAADYDGDRLLDIYVCRYNTSNQAIGLPAPYHDANNGPANALFRNLGSFRFADVTAQTGLDENNSRFSFAAGWMDFDLDGDSDLYVANDFGRNNLYRNEGGRFHDVAAELGVEDLSAGMGVSWADMDRDGDQDLYISNMFSSAGQRIAYQRRFKTGVGTPTLASFQRHARGNSLFLNRASQGFEDVTTASATWMGRWAWGAQFIDINNDGWEDIFVPNGFMTNERTVDL